MSSSPNSYMAVKSSMATSDAAARHFRVKCASLMGHSIECFDFYIYATAAVLVFPKLFFPTVDPTLATLQSFATFALAFVARPIGSIVFGHLGDRIGRKSTLIITLLTMGASTVSIGLLPTYAQIGIAAPTLLALCRLGQGFGLGGEWGGSVLLAIENSPPARQAWYGMFPQLGTPLGFFLANGLFLALSTWMPVQTFLAWGWRVPFLSSALLVIVGLWMRLRLSETPQFSRVIAQQQRTRVPLAIVITKYPRALMAAIFSSVSAFVFFYLMTVFALVWGSSELHIARIDFLKLQLYAIVGCAIMIVASARLAVRYGTRPVMLTASCFVIVFGFSFDALFSTAQQVLGFLLLGLGLMGLILGPLSTTIARMFPTEVRYTGASLAFNVAGILGASLAPYLALSLANRYGLRAVGWYLSLAAFISWVGVRLAPRQLH